jgi:hypothetical protein
VARLHVNLREGIADVADAKLGEGAGQDRRVVPPIVLRASDQRSGEDQQDEATDSQHRRPILQEMDARLHAGTRLHARIRSA